MKHSESNVFSGAVIGAVVGLGALAIFLVCQKKETALEEVGKVFSDVGEVIKQIEDPTCSKTMRDQESMLCAVVRWLATGVCLWKKIKK